jgi:hypothetical protein
LYLKLKTVKDSRYELLIFITFHDPLGLTIICL